MSGCSACRRLASVRGEAGPNPPMYADVEAAAARLLGVAHRHSRNDLAHRRRGDGRERIFQVREFSAHGSFQVSRRVQRIGQAGCRRADPRRRCILIRKPRPGGGVGRAHSRHRRNHRDARRCPGFQTGGDPRLWRPHRHLRPLPGEPRGNCAATGRRARCRNRSALRSSRHHCGAGYRRGGTHRAGWTPGQLVRVSRRRRFAQRLGAWQPRRCPPAARYTGSNPRPETTANNHCVRARSCASRYPTR